MCRSLRVHIPMTTTPLCFLVVPSGAAHQSICCWPHKPPGQAVHLLPHHLHARDATDHAEAGGNYLTTARPSLCLRCHGNTSTGVSTWCVQESPLTLLPLTHAWFTHRVVQPSSAVPRLCGEAVLGSVWHHVTLHRCLQVST